MDNGEQKKSLKELLATSNGGFEDNKNSNEIESLDFNTNEPPLETFENNKVEMSMTPMQVEPSLPDSFSEEEINGTKNFNNEYETEPLSSDNNYDYDVPKKSKLPFIIGGVVLLVIIGVLLFMVIKNNNKEPKTIEKINYRVNYNNYTFSLPENYSAFYEDDNLFIHPESNEFMANIFVVDGVFDSVKGNLIPIRQSLETSGFIITNNELKKISGRDYIAYEVKYNDVIGIITFSKLSDTQLIGVFVHNTSLTMDYTMIEKLTPVLDGLKPINNIPNHLTKEVIDYIKNSIKEENTTEE